MKRYLITAAVCAAVGLATSVGLAACQASPDDMSAEAKVERADAVLTCANGVLVGYDYRSRQYVFLSQRGRFGSVVGTLQAGVTPAQFCGQAG